MFTEVTLPIDTSTPDIESIAIASAIARRLSIGLDFVTVADATDVDERRRQLSDLASIPGVTVSTRVLIGNDIEGTLYSDAKSHPRALWCVATHAKWAFTESLVGSVSEDFVRDVGMAVVLIGPHASRSVQDDSVLVVAVDGTPASEAILPSAVELATALGIGLRIIEVLVPSKIPPGHDAEESNTVRTLADRWTTAACAVDFEVLHHEHPATAIAEYVHSEPNVAFVAMASRGTPAQARVVYPSQTYRVVRKAVCPVLVLHPVPQLTHHQHRHIVVAGIDDAVSSAEVIDVAAREAQARGAKLLVIHTWEEPVYVGGEFGGIYPITPLDDLEEAQLAILDEAVAAARLRAPDVDVIGAVTKGRASDVLVEYSYSAELVVIGHHAQSALAEALTGSVSRSVSRRASCPVVVVPCVDRD